MGKYKLAALVGIIIMGICSVPALIMTGNVLLIVSLFVMTYAFSSWQP